MIQWKTEIASTIFNIRMYGVFLMILIKIFVNKIEEGLSSIFYSKSG